MIHATYDVIVLGLGAMGTAAAFEFARRGRRVLGLEQFPIGHDRGSSHGQTRVIRKAYFEHPDYVPLLQRSYERWYDLEQRTGKHLFTECGCLNIGKPDGEIIPGVRKAARLHHLSVTEWTGAEIRRRVPALNFGDDYVGLWEKEAGFLYVEKCVQAHAEAARSLGAKLEEGTCAQSWEISGSGVVVHTSTHQYAAERLVVTAGAWAGQMLRNLNLPLQVVRKVLFWFSTGNDRSLRRDVFPVYLCEVPEGIYYGFPVIDPFGHKVARHDGGEEVTDPLTVKRTISVEDERDCRQFVAQHVPPVLGSVRQSKVCLYTLTPDRHFIIDRHPQYPQVVLAAGFSGHGFKFASVVGEILADLAEKGSSDLPIGLFRLDRFQVADGSQLG